MVNFKNLIENLIEDLIWTIKFWALTAFVPIVLTVMNIIFAGIMGVETILGFWGSFKPIWVDFYVTGSFLSIDAWRWHTGLLILSFIFVKFSD